RPSHPLGDGPRRASGEDRIDLRTLQRAGAAGAHPARHLPVQPVDQLGEAGPDLVDGETSAKEPDPAVDVVADPPGGYDPVVQVERSNAADREPVAEMDVRHGE